MIKITSSSKDDAEYTELIQHIINGASAFYKPGGVYVVEINSWFDHKWLHFSGKVMGQLGVWKKPLTVPPFHPRRVVSQNFYLWDAIEEKYVIANEYAQSLHGYQFSSRNLRREIGRRRRPTMYVWYSSDTKRAGRGSLMVYVQEDLGQASWFVSLLKKNEWQLHKSKEISLQAVADFEEAGR